MVFHPLYLLIVFMPFARNQNDIARLGKLRSRANRFPAIDDSESFTTLFGIEALQHIVQYIVRVFEPRIIRCQYYPIAQIHRFPSHHGSFPFIPVSTGSHNRNDMSSISQDVTNGTQHIVQSIGSMSIIHDSGITF